jgi:DNA-binding helix-hairpin-helix protein with protein kinase domain
VKTGFANSRGAPICLGGELGRGGEGAVFQVVEHPELVAKLYHATPDPKKAAKLVAMAGGCNQRLSHISAWPTETVHDAKSGDVRGFLMKRVSRQKDIHVLYGPKTRLRDYPEATYRFLVHVAANLARAFAVIHEHSHVVGDVNQGGVCVSAQGTITLVDCDSFQISAGGQTFSCDVGIPTYQPPELQTIQTFNGLPRTANHDAFGLAVLIFQTLFLARHPFAGAYQGSGDMPIERAIREYRFAYARDADKRMMRQPPGSLGLGAAPSHVAELFERAFLEQGARGARPNAKEWIAALDAFAVELKDCARNPGHAHAGSLGRCPLCEIEGRIGVVLFLPPRSSSVSGPTLNLEDLWGDITRSLEAGRIPNPASIPSPAAPPPPLAVVQYKLAKSRSQSIAVVGVLCSLVTAVLVHPAAVIGIFIFPLIGAAFRVSAPQEIVNIDDRVRTARQRLQTAVHQLERERSITPLVSLEGQAQRLHRQLRDYGRRRTERLQAFERGRMQRQLSRFLDQCDVAECGIKGIGSNLMGILPSFGIETADDVTEQKLEVLRNARCGFGPKRTEALLSWRRRLETRFKPIHSDARDAQERSRLERELQCEQAKGLSELAKISEQLRAYAGPLRARVAAITREIDEAQRELGSVMAIANVLGKAA